jgi:hypothetical protein
MSNESVHGTGWVTFAGILLIVGGVGAVIDAIWAFRYNDTFSSLVVFPDHLWVWGLAWLIIGIVLIAAGFGVFKALPWARWTGIIAASIAIVSNLSWARLQPTEGLIGAILATLVVYGLAAYGDVAAD